MEHAKKGNVDAINTITEMDIEIYNQTITRIEDNSEDVLSVIDSTFLPIGIEADSYRVIGYILEVKKLFNTFTNEQLYDMTIESLGYKLNICINAKDLVGEPLPGRRFRGDIWLQGYLVM